MKIFKFLFNTVGFLILLALLAVGLIILIRPNSGQPITREADPSKAAISSKESNKAVIKTPIPVINTPVAFESKPSDGEYIFSPPQLILETNKPIKIAQWLPGSNEELLAQSSTPEKYTVEIFNIKTGERKRLMEADNIVSSPVWLPATQQVAYLSHSRTDNKINLFLSDTKTQNKSIQAAADVNPPLVPARDGATVWVFDNQRGQLQKIGQEGKQLQTLTMPTPLPIHQGGPFGQYRAAWNDQTDWIAYYNQDATWLVNGQTGEVKKIDLGKDPRTKEELWTTCAAWSPDGQKLATIAGAGYTIPLFFTRLAIFDPATGQSQVIETDAIYVTDIAWAPDSQHIVLEAQVENRQGRSIIRLFLAESLTQQAKLVPVLPDIASQISFCDGLVWSSDGNRVGLTYYEYPGNNGLIGWYSLNVEQR